MGLGDRFMDYLLKYKYIFNIQVIFLLIDV